MPADRPRTHPDDLWLEIGQIVRPHGLHGSVQFRSWSGNLDPVAAGQEVRLVLRGGEERDLCIAAMRPFKKGALLDFVGIRDVAAADRLRQARVLVPRGVLGPLDEDEVFLNDLIGLEAVLPDGRIAGVVHDAVDTGPVLTLLIDGPIPGAVPYHRDWVGDPDFDAGRLPLRRKPIV